MYAVGKILKPQGIKGEVKVQILTSFPEHILELKQIYTNASELLHVEGSRLFKNFAYIKFSEISSVEQADLYRNKELVIHEKELKTLDQDEFYHHDLTNMKVYDEQRNNLGKVVAVESYPANDVIIMQDNHGNEKMIPLVKNFIKEVNIKLKEITIHLVDGLLD